MAANWLSAYRDYGDFNRGYTHNPNIALHRGVRARPSLSHTSTMSLSADDVVLECNIEILGRERPLLGRAWLEMQNMYASLADVKYPDVNAFIESCELFGVIVVTNSYFERKGALEKWNAEQGQTKGEMGLSTEPMQMDGGWFGAPRHATADMLQPLQMTFSPSRKSNKPAWLI